MTKLHLMGTGEIGIRLGGISRQRVHDLTHREDFREPCADLLQGKVWLAEDVEAWIRENRPDLQEADPAS